MQIHSNFKVYNAMRILELIIQSFINHTKLSAGVKIAHFNARRVYIDLDNELDFVTFWTKQRMTIERQAMRNQAFTPTFKPIEETLIVPVWISLPGLPWHCYYKEILTALLTPVVKVLYLDNATSHKKKGSMARIRIQLNLTK